MTLSAYVSQRPDLQWNWTAAHNRNTGNDTGWDDESETADYIRNFSSFEDYVRADYGGDFDPVYVPPPAPTLPPMPPLSVSGAAAAYANSRPDLAYNWQAAWNPSNANDGTATWIRSFGSFQAYIEHDHGGPFTSPVSTPQLPPVVNPPHPITPPVVPPINPGNTGSAISPFFDPTHRFIAQTAAGPMYMLIDEGGMIKIWIEGANGITGLRDGGRATKSAPLTAAELASQFVGTVPGLPGQPPPVNIPPGGVSPDFDPTHRLVGYTREGYEVYRLTDEGGHLVEWYDIPGRGAQGQHLLSSANDPSSYVFATTRPAIPPGVTPNVPARSNTGMLVLLLGAGALAYFAANRGRLRP